MSKKYARKSKAGNSSRGIRENPVRQTTAWVVKHARHVRVDRQAIERLAQAWAARKIKAPEWMDKVHFKHEDPERMLTYVIVLDSLNFCFWASEGKRKWHLSCGGKTYSGYFALAVGLKYWFIENPTKANFSYLADIPFKEFKKIFGGGSHLLLLKERWRILRNVSNVFVEHYEGDPRDFVSAARGRFSVLVPKIVRELPSFDDRATYDGKEVWLLKRAQILAGDIWGMFHGKGLGNFKDLGYLTAFPDYKLPQILEYEGVFEYEPRLAQKIKKGKLIRAGSREEVEIRAATVQAAEELTSSLRRHKINFYPFEVDWLLWTESKRNKLPLPHHHTETIFY